MFRFMQEPSSGSQSQCLAKITGVIPLCLSICALLVLWRHIPTCCACVQFIVQEGTFLHGEQIKNAHIDKHSGTMPIILVRH